MMVPWVYGSLVRLKREGGDCAASLLSELLAGYAYPTSIRRVRVMGGIAVR